MVTEWIGYAASFTILISLLMSSVKKLRWINTAGSLVFLIYGVLIASVPIAILNAGIILVNLYYLYQMYTKKDYFTLLEVTRKNEYFAYFMSFYQDNMALYIDVPSDIDNEEYLRFFILRNTIPAGVFVCRIVDARTLEILIDYAIPRYRDFKMGTFLFETRKDYFLNRGFTELISRKGHPIHERYLSRMGFEPSERDGYYHRSIAKG
ncbi:MAG: hypothetical protein ACLFTZ_02085 [Acholeplasmataceae bacterium]